jgi:hypothetical protein
LGVAHLLDRASWGRLDLAAGRPALLETLPRLAVETIARSAGVAKPAPGRIVEVDIDLAGAGTSIPLRLRLRTHGVGQRGGRRWDVECPCCGHGAAALLVGPTGGVSCWRCVDGHRRLSERWEHAPFWRHVLLPLGRAGRLLSAGDRPNILERTRRRHLQEADGQLASAVSGLHHLGLPPRIAALVARTFGEIRRAGRQGRRQRRPRQTGPDARPVRPIHGRIRQVESAAR